MWRWAIDKNEYLFRMHCIGVFESNFIFYLEVFKMLAAKINNQKDLILPTKEEELAVAHIVKDEREEIGVGCLITTCCGMKPNPVVGNDDSTLWIFGNNDERMKQKISLCGGCRLNHPDYATIM